jgi:LysM repeat protein
MTTPTVWSELPEPNSADRRGRDCMYCAGLMVAQYGGLATFPLGAGTVAEREALERSDRRADETGATCADLDRAMLTRYGVRLRPLARTELGHALESAGVALVVTGLIGGLPRNRRLAAASVAHAVAVVPLGGGYSLLLDPLRPAGYVGDRIQNVSVVAFNNAGGAGFECRIISAGELGQAGQPSPVDASDNHYTVVAMDTLSRIAARFGIATDALYAANAELLKPHGRNFLLPGWVLHIPAPVAPAPQPPAAPPALPGKTYTVRQHDTLAAIAAANGTTWPVLYELNAELLKPNGPDYLRPGWRIKLPK